MKAGDIYYRKYPSGSEEYLWIRDANEKNDEFVSVVSTVTGQEPPRDTPTHTRSKFYIEANYIKIEKTELPCHHQWHLYVGLTQQYQFCLKCDEKQSNDDFTKLI